MLILVSLLLLLNLILLGWLLNRQMFHGRELVALAGTAETLAPLRAGIPPDLAHSLDAGSSHLISIEILNPMELAAKESRLARTFGSMTPSLIRREVYRQARDIIELQMREQGVEPRVTVHHGR